jgi:hypothetical protein
VKQFSALKGIEVKFRNFTLSCLLQAAPNRRNRFLVGIEPGFAGGNGDLGIQDYLPEAVGINLICDIRKRVNFWQDNSPFGIRLDVAGSFFEISVFDEFDSHGNIVAMVGNNSKWENPTDKRLS